MPKDEEIDILTDRLVERGMDRGMAYKNLLECDRYFIEALGKII
jgi:hypothetical protein